MKCTLFLLEFKIRFHRKYKIAWELHFFCRSMKFLMSMLFKRDYTTTVASEIFTFLQCSYLVGVWFRYRFIFFYINTYYKSTKCCRHSFVCLTSVERFTLIATYVEARLSDLEVYMLTFNYPPARKIKNRRKNITLNSGYLREIYLFVENNVRLLTSQEEITKEIRFSE